MRYAPRYNQHVSQSPDDCEGCVTMRITNFTAKAFTWPWVEEINGEADIFERASKKQVSTSSVGLFMWLLHGCVRQYHHSRERKWNATQKGAAMQTHKHCFQCINYETQCHIMVESASAGVIKLGPALMCLYRRCCMTKEMNRATLSFIH